MTDPTPSTDALIEAVSGHVAAPSVAALVARTRELESEREAAAQQAYLATGSLTTTREAHAAEVNALRAEVERLRDELAHEQRCAAARSQPVEPHLSTTLTADNAALRARLASTEAELDGERQYRVQQTTAWADELAAMKAERDEARRERDEAVAAKDQAGELMRRAVRLAEEAKQVMVDQGAFMDGLNARRDADLAEAKAEADDAHALFPPILQKVCDALKGPTNGTLIAHSWHDLGEVAAATVAERDAALAKLAEVSEVVGVMLNVEQQPIRIAEVPRLRERLTAALSRAPSAALAERDARVRAEALEEGARLMKEEAARTCSHLSDERASAAAEARAKMRGWTQAAEATALENRAEAYQTAAAAILLLDHKEVVR